MGETLFYERAVALDRVAHQNIRIHIQADHYQFAHETNALPIAASEFADAGRHYPIVFVGDDNNNFHMAVLLGLEDRNNLFVSDNGVWKPDTYIPAFARRYPFVLGTTGDSDRLAVCIDEAYPGVNEHDGIPLFQDGSETDYLKQMMEFLREFQKEMELTRNFANRMKELGLLTAKSITISQEGKNRYLSGFWVIDDEKLQGIDDIRAAELFRSGALRLIELHRASLGNVQRLAARLEQVRRASPSAEIPAGDAVEDADAIPSEVETEHAPSSRSVTSPTTH